MRRPQTFLNALPSPSFVTPSQSRNLLSFRLLFGDPLPMQKSYMNATFIQGDHSDCLKPPVDFDFITRHVRSGGYFVS